LEKDDEALKKAIRKMNQLGEDIGILSLQINRDSSLTDVALTITHLLEKNLVTTYDAET
jgi:hypothetical protein